MFVDQVDIEVKAGDGGNGAVAFRREKYVPHGGPSGGDGGRGGSVVLEVDPHLSTLLDFRYKRRYQAERGGDGGSKDMFGRDGADLILKVPPGTTVRDRNTGELIADLWKPGQRVVVARGGIGGRGNVRFATSVHQAPKFAEKGEPGEERPLRLELKLLADVGLLGFPSVGKSTLIAAVSAARPKIADYPFTTLVPNLGVVYIDEQKSFVMADLPGLIEGAHAGAGLGFQFLRHAERTRVLVHVLDVSGLTGRDPLDDFRVLNRELALHSEDLARIPQVVALNKIDVAADPALIDRVEKALTQEGHAVFRISAATRQGLEPLLYHIWNRLEESRRTHAAVSAEEPVRITAPARSDLRQWEVRREADGTWVVKGRGFERMVAMTDVANEHAMRRLHKALERAGVIQKLRALGARDGDTVRIRDVEFDFMDEDQEEERLGRRTRRHKEEAQ